MILNRKDELVLDVAKQLEIKYNVARSTIKKCSYDDENDVYLCESEDVAYDFDKIKEKYCEHMKYKDMSSMDALIEIDSKKMIYLVEFKNKAKLPYKDLRAKIHDSLFIIENEFGIIRDMFSVLELIVVYNPDKNKRKKLKGIRDHFKALAGEKYDEIEHFKMFKDRYDISSYKFSAEDFLEYLKLSS